MQLERLVARTRTRFSRGALAGLLRSAQAGAEAATGKSDAVPALRGSGSWANDWSQDAEAQGGHDAGIAPRERGTGGSAMERAMFLAQPGRDRPGPPLPCSPQRPPAPLPAAAQGGGIRTKPLMSLQDVRLHNWLTDRLEAEAPTCSLHARVAFSAFLATGAEGGGPDPLQGLVADMLIADRTGQPVAALLRTGPACAPRCPGLLEMLREADLPVVDLPPRPGLAELWGEISPLLPGD